MRRQALGELAFQRLGPGQMASHGGVGVGQRIHGTIPLLRSASAKAWTAREQWVLTLPSEQPITAAVSAVSNSSQ
jgi:hypothetical protein